MEIPKYKMNVTASEPDDAKPGFLAPRAHRDLTGAYPVVQRRWRDVVGSGRELLSVMASHPLALARAQTRLSLEMSRIALGRSRLRPAPDDDRFEHPFWQENAGFRRVLQGYLAWSTVLLDLIHDLRLKPEQKRRLLFVARHMIAAGAPSNVFFTHPGFYDNAWHSRGRSVVSGVRHLLEDLRDNRGLPRQVDTSAFRIGHNIAATEGAVVFRNEVFELIQYSPRSPSVDSRAVLFCPAQINKYYVVDLSPEKSFVRYALDAGQQMFTISWRNPTAAKRDWGLATYADAVCEAVDVVRAVTDGQPVKLVGACAGGLTATAALARLAAVGEQDKVACLSLFVTVLESPHAFRLGRVPDAAGISAVTARSSHAGVLDGADMARAFAWLRPNDLIWRFVTNNYVLGNEPPAFDVLYWNSDTTRMPARLHADMLAIYRDDTLSTPGALELDGVAVDVRAIDRDVFVVAGARDHITPWQDCYRSMQMFRSNVRFVLGAAGHVQTILCPPGSHSARYHVNDDYSLDAAAWRRRAREQYDSWWPAWVRWCEAHGGERRAPPEVYGDDEHEPIEAAPGRYVRQR